MYLVFSVQVKVIWVVMLCGVVVGYQHFGGPWKWLSPLKQLVSYHNTTHNHNPEDCDFNLDHHENFKSTSFLCVYF
jgi:hypothetical protein